MIGLIIDTGCNVPEIIRSRFPMKIVPLRIILDKKEYRDGLEIDQATIIEYMIQHYPKTSLPYMEDIQNAFMEYIEQGCKQIIAINMSSGLSGTYNSFRVVVQKLKKSHPDVRVELIDSCSVSIGTGLIVYKVAQWIDQGVCFDEIIKRAYQTLKRSQIFFIVPTLRFLTKGGRLSRVSGTLGEWFKIKPIISMTQEGMLHPIAKAPGFQLAMKELIKQVRKFVQDKEMEAIGIYHSGESEQTKSIIETIKKEIQKLSPPELYFGTITSTILVHGGPGVIGIGVLLKE